MHRPAQGMLNGEAVMKKIPGKIAVLAGGLALLPVAIAGATLLLVQPDSYRAQIIAGVKQETGAELGLTQPLHWQLWPLGFQTDAVTLSDASGHEKLMEAGHIAARLRLSSLLSGTPAFSGFALDDAKVFLSPQENDWNWTATLQKLQANPASTPVALSFSNSSLFWQGRGEAPAQEIAFSRFELQDDGHDGQPLEAEFTVTHQDAAGNNLLLQNTLKAKLQHAGQPKAGVIRLTATEFGSAVSSTLFPGNLELKLQGDAELSAGTLRIPALTVEGSYKSLGMENPVTVSASSHAEIDFAQSQISLQQLQTRGKAGTALKLQADTLLSNWSSGHVSASNLQLAYTPAQAAQAVTLTGQLDADLQQGLLKLSSFQITAANSKADGSLSATLPFLGRGLLSNAGHAWSGVKIDGELASDNFDPATLLSLAGLPATTGKTAGALKTRIEGRDDSFFLRDLVLTGPDVALRGEAGVTGLDSAPRYSAKLQADRVMLDKLLPASAQTSGTRLPGTEKLKALNLDLSLRAKSLQAGAQTWSDVQLEASAHEGKTSVTVLRATSGKSSFSLPLTLDASGQVLVIDAKPDIRNMDAALLSPLMGNKPLTGQFSSKGNLHLEGSTLEAWQKSASGQLSFRLENGSSAGGNLMKGIMAKVDGYKSLLPELAPGAEKIGEGEQTRIVLLDTESTFNKGIITTKLLALDLGKARISGDGHFDAGQQTLDYGITLNLDQSVFTGQGKGLSLPMECKGNLLEEQTDFFSALGDDCKMTDAAKSDIMSRALTRRFRES